MITNQEREQKRGATTLADLVRRISPLNIDLRLGLEGTPLMKTQLIEHIESFADRATTIEQELQRASSRPEGVEIALIEDFWQRPNEAVQHELNKQLNLNRQENPIHTRQVQIRVNLGSVDVEYRDCPGLTPVPSPTGTTYQWYFRRVSFPANTHLLRIPELSRTAIGAGQPDQLVLRRRFP